MNHIQNPDVSRMLALIALFEGSSGGRINTWDEQYLSLGTMHFAVGQGSGVRFLQRVHELDPAGTLACLGRDFTAAIAAGPQSIKTFCRDRVWRTRTWGRAFVALSRLEAFKRADAEACEPYLNGALLIARRYNLRSERGLMFALDRSVQQGWGARTLVDAGYRKLPAGAAESTVLKTLARDYSLSALPKYRDVVYARALTCATGDSAGTGYPGSINLERQYGISGTRPWRLAGEPIKDAGLRVFLEDAGGRNIVWDGDESGVYGGVPLKRNWLTEVRDTLPRDTRTKLRGIFVTVFSDGALLLERE